MPASARFNRRFKRRIGFDVLQIVGSTTFQTATVGSSYASTLSAQGGSSPYTFSAINALSSGLSMGSDGTFSGTPSSAATSTFAIQVQDNAGSTARQNFVLTVSPSTQLQLTTSTRLASATVNSTYSATFASTGGTPPYSSYTAVTSLPSGFTLSSSGGLTGTLTSTGMSSFTIQVKDNAGSTASKQYSIVAQSTGAHAFFETLLARGDFLKALSFRPISTVVSTAGGYSTGTLAEGTLNPYYNNQLLPSSGGGYRGGSSNPYTNMTALTYSPGSDTHAQAQDAAKIALPAFGLVSGVNGWTLNGDHSSATSTLVITAPQSSSGVLVNNLSLRVDNEIVQLESVVGWDSAQPTVNTPRRLASGSTNVWELHVKRGQNGTAASTHTTGANVPRALNSIPTSYQIRYPLKTSDSHTYLITWDVYYTDEWIGFQDVKGNKFFQFSDYGDSIWLETKMDFNGTPTDNYWPVCSGWSTTTYVSDFSVRSYNNINNGSTTWSTSISNMLGPGTTRELPLSPPSGTFCVPAGKWVRLFWYIDQRANDWDPVTFWAADETREAVKILDAIKVSVRPSTNGTVNTILNWWLEWNDSASDHQRGDAPAVDPFRDLPIYIRNLCVLRDPSTSEFTSTGLLAKPVG